MVDAEDRRAKAVDDIQQLQEKLTAMKPIGELSTRDWDAYQAARKPITSAIQMRMREASFLKNWIKVRRRSTVNSPVVDGEYDKFNTLSLLTAAMRALRHIISEMDAADVQLSEQRLVDDIQEHLTHRA